MPDPTAAIPTGSLLSHLECAKMGETYDADTLPNRNKGDPVDQVKRRFSVVSI